MRILRLILLMMSVGSAWIVPSWDTQDPLFERTPLWEAGVGLENPWREAQIWNAFVFWRRNTQHWGLRAALSHAQVDSIYQSNSWETEGFVRYSLGALDARYQRTQQLVPGLSSLWTQASLLQLGLQPFSSWNVLIGMLAEDSCVQGNFSIQWELGESYRMELQLNDLAPLPSSLQVRQTLHVGLRWWATLAWRYPLQTVSASFTWGLPNLFLQAGELWAPELPPSPNASVRLQRIDSRD